MDNILKPSQQPLRAEDQQIDTEPGIPYFNQIQQVIEEDNDDSEMKTAILIKPQFMAKPPSKHVTTMNLPVKEELP